MLADKLQCEIFCCPSTMMICISSMTLYKRLRHLSSGVMLQGQIRTSLKHYAFSPNAVAMQPIHTPFHFANISRNIAHLFPPQCCPSIAIFGKCQQTELQCEDCMLPKHHDSLHFLRHHNRKSRSKTCATHIWAVKGMNPSLNATTNPILDPNTDFLGDDQCERWSMGFVTLPSLAPHALVVVGQHVRSWVQFRLLYDVSHRQSDCRISNMIGHTTNRLD
jgi:hypothetical protein